jgi:hypothetical protein
MCSKEATSKEHVPPRCLFPESRDIQSESDLDFRKELITVPACTDHNSKKSKDDEYLLTLLAITLPANEIAKNHFLTKVRRSIKRNPRLITALMENRCPVTVINSQTGEIQNTTATRIEDVRLNSVLEHIARALYFHHFKEPWQGSVKTQCDFLLASLDLDDQNLNNQCAELAEGADHIFAKCEFYGANPDVFKYQVLENGIDKLMRLHFYEGCRVSVFFR